MSSLILLGEFLERSQSESLEVAINALVSKIPGHFFCEAASLWLAEGDELLAHASAGPVSITGLKVPISDSRVGRVYDSGEADYFHTQEHEGNINRSIDKASGFVTRDLLTVPITWAGKRYGALQLVNSTRRVGVGFRREDRDDIEIFGASLGAAFLNKELAAQQTLSALLDRDLAQAKEAQKMLFPENCSWAAGKVIPYRGLSGDFYDFWEQDGERLFVFGDVAGKGVPAALTVSRILTTLKAFLKDGASLEHASQNLNRELINSQSGFSTLVVGRITENALTYVNCGHAEFFAVGSKLQPLAAEYPPLGVVDLEIESVQVPMAGFERLVAVSDGLSEYRGQEPAGWSPIEERVISCAPLLPKEACEQLCATVESGQFPQHDDTSALVVKAEKLVHADKQAFFLG